MRQRIALCSALLAMVCMVACGGAGTDCSTSRSIAGSGGGTGSTRTGSGGCQVAAIPNTGGDNSPNGPFCTGRAGDTRFLYVGDLLKGNIDTFALADNGQVDFLCHSAKVDFAITQMAVANNTFLYAYSSDNAHLFAFTANGPVLNPVAGSPFTVGTRWSSQRAYPLALDPSSRFVYAADQNARQINSLSISSTGVVAPIAESPAEDAGLTIAAIALHPTGKFLYTINGNSIAQFSVNTATGAVAPLTPATVPYDVVDTATAGGGIVKLVTNPQGSFLYVIATKSVSFYTIDQATGALTFANVAPASLPTPDDSFPWDAVVEPSGHFLYIGDVRITNANPGGVDAFSVDRISGVLTPIAGQPFLNDQGKPFHLAADANAHVWVMVGSSTGTRLFGLAIDPNTGVLTLLSQTTPTAFPAAANSPIAIAVPGGSGR